MKKIFVLLLSLSLFLLSGCALLETGDARLHTFHTVIIDPGHGGSDPGARATKGLCEKTLSLDVAQRLKPLLKEQGYQVVMTRNSDTFVSLEERVAIANKTPDSIFISIHFNASPRRSASGVETYYYTYSSKPLAAAIFDKLCWCRKCHRRGVKWDTLYVLSHNRRPATLLELGFVSNRQENTFLQTPQARQQLAKQITAGIERVRSS